MKTLEIPLEVSAISDEDGEIEIVYDYDTDSSSDEMEIPLSFNMKSNVSHLFNLNLRQYFFLILEGS